MFQELFNELNKPQRMAVRREYRRYRKELDRLTVCIRMSATLVQFLSK